MSFTAFQKHFLHKLHKQYTAAQYPTEENNNPIIRDSSNATKSPHDRALNILKNLFAKNDFSKQLQIAQLVGLLDNTDKHSLDSNGNLINLTKEQSYLFEEIFDIAPVQISSSTQDLYAVSEETLEMVNKLLAGDLVASAANGFATNATDVVGTELTAVQNIQKKQYSIFIPDDDLSRKKPIFVINEVDLFKSLGDEATVWDLKEKLTEIAKNKDDLTLYEYCRAKYFLDSLVAIGFNDADFIDDNIKDSLYFEDRKNQKTLNEYGIDGVDDIEIGNYPERPPVGSENFDFFSYIDSLLEDIVIYPVSQSTPIIDQSQFLRLTQEKLVISIAAKLTFEGTQFSLPALKNHFNGNNNLYSVLTHVDIGIDDDVAKNISDKISQKQNEIAQARNRATQYAKKHKTRIAFQGDRVPAEGLMTNISANQLFRRKSIDSILLEITEVIINSNCGDYLIAANDDLQKGNIFDYIIKMEEAIKQSFPQNIVKSNEARAIFLYSFIEKLPENEKALLSSSNENRESYIREVKKYYNRDTEFGEAFLERDERRFINKITARIKADAEQLTYIRSKSLQPIILDSTSQKTDTDQICSDFAFYNIVDSLSKRLYERYYSPTSGYTHLDRKEDDFDRIEDLFLNYKKKDNFKILKEIAKAIDFTENSQRQYLVQAIEFIESPDYKDGVCNIDGATQVALKNLFGIPGTNYNLQMVDIEGIKERLKDYDLSKFFQITVLQGNDQFQEILDNRDQEDPAESEKRNILSAVEELKSRKLRNRAQNKAKDHILEAVKIGIKTNHKPQIESLLATIEENTQEDVVLTDQVIVEITAEFIGLNDEHRDGFKEFLDAQKPLVDDTRYAAEVKKKNIAEINKVVKKALYAVNTANIISDTLEQKALHIGQRLRVNLQIPGKDSEKNTAINNLIQLSQIGLASGSKDGIEGLLKELTTVQANIASGEQPNREILSDCDQYFNRAKEAIKDESSQERFEKCYDAYIGFLKKQLGPRVADETEDKRREREVNVVDLKQMAALAIYEINEAEIDVAVHEVAKSIKYYDIDKATVVPFGVDGADISISQYLEKLNKDIYFLKDGFNKARKSAKSLSRFISKTEEYADDLLKLKEYIEDNSLAINQAQGKEDYVYNIVQELADEDITLRKRLNLEIQLKNLELKPYKSKTGISQEDKEFLQAQAKFEIDNDLEYKAGSGIENGDLNAAILDLIFATSQSEPESPIDQRKSLEKGILNLIVDYHAQGYHDKDNGLGEIFEKYKAENKSYKFFNIIQNILTNEKPFKAVDVREGDESEEANILQIQNALNEEIEDGISDIITSRFSRIKIESARINDQVKAKLAADISLKGKQKVNTIYDSLFSEIAAQGQIDAFIKAVTTINELINDKNYSYQFNDQINDIENILNKVYKSAPRKRLQEAKEIIISPLLSILESSNGQGNIHNIFKNKRFGNDVKAEDAVELLCIRAHKYYAVSKENLQNKRNQQKALDSVFTQELEYFDKFSRYSKFKIGNSTVESSLDSKKTIFFIHDLLKNRSARSTFNVHNISDIDDIKVNEKFNAKKYSVVNSFVESVLTLQEIDEGEFKVKVAKKNFDQLSEDQKLEVYQSYIISQYCIAIKNSEDNLKFGDANQAIEYLMIAKFIETEFGLNKSKDGSYYFKELTNLAEVSRNDIQVGVQQRIKKLVDLRSILIGNGKDQDIDVSKFVKDKIDNLAQFYGSNSDDYSFTADQIIDLYNETLKDDNYSKIEHLTASLARQSNSQRLKSLIEYRNEFNHLAASYLADIQDNPHQFEENQKGTILYSVARGITDHINERFQQNITKLSDSIFIAQLDEEVKKLRTDFRRIIDLTKSGELTSIDEILQNKESPFLVGSTEIDRDTTKIVQLSYKRDSKYRGNEYSAYPKELHDVLYKGQNIARLETLNNNLIDKIEIRQYYRSPDNKSHQDSALSASAWFDTDIILPKEVFGDIAKQKDKPFSENIFAQLESYKAFVKVAIALNMEHEISVINDSFLRKGGASEVLAGESAQRLAAINAIYDRFEDFSKESRTLGELDGSRFYDVDINTIKSFKEQFQNIENRQFIRGSLRNPNVLMPEVFQVAKSVFQISTRAINISHTGSLYDLNKHNYSPGKNLYSEKDIKELEARKKTLYKESGSLGSRFAKASKFSQDDHDLEILKRKKENADKESGGSVSRFFTRSSNEKVKAFKELESQYQSEVDKRLQEVEKEVGRRSTNNILKVQKFFNETSRKRSPGIRHNLSNVLHNVEALTSSANKSQKDAIDGEIQNIKKELGEGAKESRKFIWKIKDPTKGTISGLFSSKSSRNKKRNAATLLASVMYDNIHYLDQGDMSGEDIFNSKVATYIESLVSSSSEYSEKEMKGFFRFIKNAYLLAKDDNKVRKDITTFLGFCGNRQDFIFAKNRSGKFLNKSHFANEQQGELEENFRARADAAFEQFEEVDKGLRALTNKLTSQIKSSYGQSPEKREKIVSKIQNDILGGNPSSTVVPTEAERFMDRVQRASKKSFTNIFDNIQVDDKCSIHYHKNVYEHKIEGDKREFFENIIRHALVNAINKINPEDRSKVIAGGDQLYDAFSKEGVLEELNKKFITEMKNVGISKYSSESGDNDLQIADIPERIINDLNSGKLVEHGSTIKSMSVLIELNHSLIENLREDSKQIDIKKPTPSTSMKKPFARNFLGLESIGMAAASPAA